MPCMGPSDRQDAADRAFEEFFTVLKTKYGINDPDNGGMIFEKDCIKAKQNLKEAIREMFKMDSYDAF